MTEVNYYCDVCRDRIDPESPNGGVGLYYKGEIKERWEFLSVQHLKSPEHHLCGACLKSIGEHFACLAQY